MLPASTPAVERALKVASQYARLENANTIQAVHLVRGLLAESEGRAAEQARLAGLNRESYRQANPTPSISEGETILPLDALVQSALFEARRLGRDHLGEEDVSSEALLLALLRAPEAPRHHLEEHGFQLGKLEAALEGHRGPALQLEQPLELADLTERVHIARIQDAVTNRAREGLRVVEDYCRFVLDDRFLNQTLKELRHELTAILEQFEPDLLLEARDTQGDVGTTVTTASEGRRHSLLGVVQANFKRLQEALRSLEEFTKLDHPDLGQRLERLRYRSYTLETAVLHGTQVRQRLEYARLYILLSGETCAAALDWTIHEAVAGGATVVQLREKSLGDREWLERARNVRRWTRDLGVLFLVNDRPDLARLAEADGVHLGQEDLPVREARRILGPSALIGVSTHNMEQLHQAILDGASYVGVGPAFPSQTKAFHEDELAGLDYVQQALAETTLPAFVLGGINETTIGQAVAVGTRRVAVSHCIASADDPRKVASTLMEALTANEENE